MRWALLGPLQPQCHESARGSCGEQGRTPLISFWQCQGKGASPPGSIKDEIPHKFEGIFPSVLKLAGDSQRELMGRFKPLQSKAC